MQYHHTNNRRKAFCERTYGKAISEDTNDIIYFYEVQFNQLTDARSKNFLKIAQRPNSGVVCLETRKSGRTIHVKAITAEWFSTKEADVLGKFVCLCRNQFHESAKEVCDTIPRAKTYDTVQRKCAPTRKILKHIRLGKPCADKGKEDQRQKNYYETLLGQELWDILNAAGFPVNPNYLSKPTCGLFEEQLFGPPLLDDFTFPPFPSPLTPPAKLFDNPTEAISFEDGSMFSCVFDLDTRDPFFSANAFEFEISESNQVEENKPLPSGQIDTK